jgi:hypothetical protein
MSAGMTSCSTRQYIQVSFHSYLPLYFRSAAFMPVLKGFCQSRCFQ